MKTRNLQSLLLGLLVLACSQAALQAQSYSIDWSKIASGGGTSTNGQYSVSGTIGQPDTGTMSGGGYLVTGGFWSIIAAVQTPGAPLLRITQTNGVVAVSWPNSPAGWVLDASTPSSRASRRLGARSLPPNIRPTQRRFSSPSAHPPATPFIGCASSEPRGPENGGTIGPSQGGVLRITNLQPARAGKFLSFSLWRVVASAHATVVE